jgi:hypothetical protein
MSRETANFVDLCLSGEALSEEIDDYVEAWHEGGSGLPLHAFLGMTREEYGSWVEEPSILNVILEARMRGKPISQTRRG